MIAQSVLCFPSFNHNLELLISAPYLQNLEALQPSHISFLSSSMLLPHTHDDPSFIFYCFFFSFSDES